MNIDEAIKKERINAEDIKEHINSPEPGIKASKCLEMAEEHEQIANWLEELKTLKEEKEYWDIQNHKAYNQGREDMFDECLQIVQKIKDDYNDSKFGERIPINYGTICGIIIAMEQLQKEQK